MTWKVLRPDRFYIPQLYMDYFLQSSQLQNNFPHGKITGCGDSHLSHWKVTWEERSQQSWSPGGLRYKLNPLLFKAIISWWIKTMVLIFLIFDDSTMLFTMSFTGEVTYMLDNILLILYIHIHDLLKNLHAIISKLFCTLESKNVSSQWWHFLQLEAVPWPISQCSLLVLKQRDHHLPGLVF